VLDMCTLGDAADVNPVTKFLRYNACRRNLITGHVDICRVTKGAHIEHL
jgi:hypothetical protein